MWEVGMIYLQLVDKYGKEEEEDKEEKHAVS